MIALMQIEKTQRCKRSHRNDEILAPYKKIIKNSLYPSFSNPISLSTGKAAISAYKKTTNDPDGTLELMMFYVECGNQFTVDLGDIDENFYCSLETMFEKILEILKTKQPDKKNQYLPRL